MKRLERRYRKEPTIQNQSTWKSELRRSRRTSQEKSSKYWKDKISTTGNDARKVWRSVDALLGEEKVAADQSITAQMFHDFIDKKVADIRASTASAPDPTYTSYKDSSIFCGLTKDCIHHSDPQKGISGPTRPRQLPANFELLTFLSKLLERATYEQIVGYMECHHLLPPFQSAYQKHRSTETATIKVMSDIYRAADAGLVTLLGLLDLSAAFDTVDHMILLDRLQHCYGISGHVLRWIESYLTGRSQFVRFNGETSGTMMVTSGVPQGIGAGPDPFHRVFCRSHRHRGAAGLQRATLLPMTYRSTGTPRSTKLLSWLSGCPRASRTSKLG